MEQSYSSDEIYSALEREIIGLQIKPGEVISENALCARFSVSRTPIRSVLQRLQLNGLVLVKPYRGTVVTPLDFDVINQIIYQRVAVESMVLRDFAADCQPADIERVRHNITSARALVGSEGFNLDDFYELDSQLHEIWFSRTRKMYLWESFQRAQQNYSRFRMLDILVTKNFDEILSEHESILSLLERRAAQEIEPIIHRHLYGGIKRLGRLIFTDFKDYFVNLE